MKRHGRLFEQITDPENIRLAWRDARRGKRWQRAVVRFEDDLEANLDRIRRSLVERTFRTAPYRTMMIHEPKDRLIYRLPFDPDRIVQHALMRVLMPIWESLFISDSYACIRGKGIHAGSRRTMAYVRRYRYCLKMDIAKFYPSIDHDVLMGIVARKIKCEGTLWLARDIIYSIGGGKNAPIGNFTSQWFGNLYLNDLDQWLKHTHRLRGYIRYCDDFCLFHDDKKYLGCLAAETEAFLADRLRLRLSQCDLFPVSRGVDFLGYRHFPDRVLLRKSTALRIRRRLRRLPLELARGRITIDQYRSTLASVTGWLRWANTYHLQQSLAIGRLHEVLNGSSPEVQGFCAGASAPRRGEDEDRRHPGAGDFPHRLPVEAEQVRVGGLPHPAVRAGGAAPRRLHGLPGPGGADAGVRGEPAVLRDGAEDRPVLHVHVAGGTA